MNIDYKVPFYSNTPDDTHCLQAGIRSVLKYFEPQEEFTWEELDQATAKVKGLWTWPMAGLIWLHKRGYDIRNVEEFDYGRFIKEGKLYINEKYGEEVANAQEKNSDIPQEQRFSKEFIKLIKYENREATLEEILHYLKEGYLVGVNVNYRSLRNRTGYAGHFVLIKGVKGEKLILHDPGLPPIENMEVSLKQFDKGWAYPSHHERNLMAFKKP